MQFDKQQIVVVSHVTGHALVLAGAGAGKTASIVERAHRLIIDHNYRADSILMVTFTNKAAREMRQRIYAKLLKVPDYNIDNQPVVTTFHSFGQRIIFKNTEACGRVGHPSVLPEDDQTSLLQASLKKYTNDFNCKMGVKFYDKIRNNGVAVSTKEDEVAVMSQLVSLCDSQPEIMPVESIMAGYLDYEQTKKDNNALDYHDLIILPIQALRKDPILLAKVQRRLIDITVDEAQDTNLAQYILMNLIAPPDSPGQSVIMIGDEDQSIHGWRGANKENIRMFNESYKPKILRMEFNYRSAEKIVTSSNNIIRNNSDRFEKTGIPTRKNSDVVIDYRKSATSDDMSDTIARQIKADIDAGVPVNEIAVLYRTNKMANILEPALIGLAIPYKIYNGQDLLGRVESKIILAAIRFAVNPMDTLAFSKLAELMPGVGKKLIDKLCDDTKSNETLFDATMRLPDSQQLLVAPMLSSILKLRKEGPTAIMQWVSAQPEIRKWVAQKNITHLKTQKINPPKEFEVWKRYNKNETITSEERIMLGKDKAIERCAIYNSRLKEAIANSVERMNLVCRSITERCEQLPKHTTIEDLWFEASNIVAAPPDEENKKPSIHLMTMHSAKGLEWDHVYLAGVSEGILPFYREAGDDTNKEVIEGERRLAYVGYTRGKNKLVVHHCNKINLMDGKGYRHVKPSRFIREAQSRHYLNNDDANGISPN